MYEQIQIKTTTPQQQIKFKALMAELDKEAVEREPYNRHYRQEIRRHNEFRAEIGDKP